MSGDSTSQRPPGRIGWALLSPLLLWLALLVLAPTLILIAYSITSPAGPAQVQWTPSANGYAQLSGAAALAAFWRSVWFALLTTALCVLAGYPVAYFIGRAPATWRNRLLVLIMIPFWTSFLIRTYAWIIILRKEGLLNAALQATHLTSAPLDLLYTPSAELIGYVYTFLPFMILPIYGSVEKLDTSLIEAALDLGATPIRAFRSVILPLTWPGVVAGILLVFVPAVGMFAITDVLGGRKRLMIGNLIEQQFVGRGGDWPYGSAMGVVVLALFVIAYLVLAALRRESTTSA
jgi:spermidine/putrescine transport system permease protein